MRPGSNSNGSPAKRSREVDAMSTTFGNRRLAIRGGVGLAVLLAVAAYAPECAAWGRFGGGGGFGGGGFRGGDFASRTGGGFGGGGYGSVSHSGWDHQDG